MTTKKDQITYENEDTQLRRSEKSIPGARDGFVRQELNLVMPVTHLFFSPFSVFVATAFLRAQSH